jgi:hypothetical protein
LTNLTKTFLLFIKNITIKDNVTAALMYAITAKSYLNPRKKALNKSFK